MKILVSAEPPVAIDRFKQESFIFSKEILHSQQLQRGQQVQGSRAHHGLQRGPRLHEHPEVRLLPENRKKIRIVRSLCEITENKSRMGRLDAMFCGGVLL